MIKQTGELKVDLIDRDALKIHVCDMCYDGIKECKVDEPCAILCWINDMPAINHWIPVENSLPNTDGEYLVYADHYEIVEYDSKLRQFGHTDRYIDEQGYDVAEWYEVHNVTHWMPLHEPPRKGLQNG